MDAITRLATAAGCLTQAQQRYLRDEERYNTRRLATLRGRAWHATMMAAVNAGLERKLFGLQPGENWWPRTDPNEGHTFTFELDDIPGLACVRDAGWDELRINVVLWPTNEARRSICCGMPHRRWAHEYGEVTAEGWMERRDGTYLQPSTSLFFCSRARIDRMAAMNVKPRGYRDRGRFRM